MPSFISECGLGGIRKSAPIKRLAAAPSLESFVMRSVPFPKLTVGGLNLTACTEFAHANLNIPHLKTPGLQWVSGAFRFNIARVRFMMLVPAHIGDLSTRMQHLLDVAVIETAGTLTDFSKIKDDEIDTIARVTARFKELFDAELNTRVEEREKTGWHEAALALLKIGTAPAELLASLPPPMSNGLSAMLSSYLTGTWTAFETMCGDLWETALNISPSRLAHLKGNPKRLFKNAVSNREDSFDQGDRSNSKSVPLDIIQRLGFDVKNRMGTVLRESRFEFSRLSDIRRAYASAFDIDNSDIDAALSHKSIDALRVVRNLIIHQSGLADDAYLKLIPKLKLPFAGKGRPILLDGPTVINMISPVISCSSRLMGAVDSWLIKHPGQHLDDGAKS
ncbi:MAG: hypothetical protein WAL80_11385 [Xanthobacteraceae bacterium]